MKTRLTLTLDSDLLRQVERLAARRGLSVSQLLTEELEVAVSSARSYESAKRHALERLAKGLDFDWTRPDSRDELHER